MCYTSHHHHINALTNKHNPCRHNSTPSIRTTQAQACDIWNLSQCQSHCLPTFRTKIIHCHHHINNAMWYPSHHHHINALTNKHNPCRHNPTPSIRTAQAQACDIWNLSQCQSNCLPTFRTKLIVCHHHINNAMCYPSHHHHINALTNKHNPCRHNPTPSIRTSQVQACDIWNLSQCQSNCFPTFRTKTIACHITTPTTPPLPCVTHQAAFTSLLPITHC